MSDLSMWFGTRGYMQWVPCPLIDSDMSKVGWNSQAQYLNGGTRIRSSVTAHKEYNLAWGLQERDNIRTITDYADGVYGDDLIYFVDPFAADKNVLPQYWATPALAAEDAPILTGTAKPSLVETDSNTNGYPRYSAVYYVLPTDPKKNIYVPIPPGYTAWVGFHGQKPDDSTAYVRVRQAIGATGYGTSTALTPLSNDTTVQVNANFNSSTTVHGIVLDLQGTGTLIMTSLIVQLRKTSSEYGTTRTNLVTNPSMESVNAGSVVMRRNLVTNPSFEVDGSGWGSVNGTGSTLAASTDRAWIGTKSLKFTYGTSTAQDSGPAFNLSGLVAGMAYTLSAYVYTSNVSTLGGYRMGVYGTAPGNTLRGTAATETNTWTRISMTFTAVTSGTATLFIGKTSDVSASGSVIYVDAVMLEASSVAGDYFDGNTTDALGYVYDWTSTVNGSISTAACAATTVRTNLITNPSLEVDATGYKRISTAGNLTTRVTTQAYSGSASLESAFSNSDGAFFDVSSLTASSTYTFSVWVKGTAGDTVRLDLNERVSSTTDVGTTTGNVVTLTGSWQRLSVTRTFGATGVYARLLMRNVSATMAGPTYWDALQLEVGSTASDYFDGSFPPADNFSYAWTNTDNASTSIQRGATVTGWSVLTSATISQVTSQKYIGSSSLLVAATAINAGAQWTVSTVAASTTYTFSAYVKGEVGKSIYLEILEQDSGGTEIGRNTGSNIPMTGDWQQLSISRTFTTGVRANVRVRNSAVSATHTFYVDAAMLEASPIVQSYFDGSTAGYGNVTYGWTNSALPNASTSYQYVTPTTGGYISGQGHSGCKFAEQPKLQNYSSAMDKVALTATLVEVGAWA